MNANARHFTGKSWADETRRQQNTSPYNKAASFYQGRRKKHWESALNVGEIAEKGATEDSGGQGQARFMEDMEEAVTLRGPRAYFGRCRK